MQVRRRLFLSNCTALALALGVGGPAAAAPTAGRGTAPVIVVIGDSLSAEYGLKRGSGWVALLEAQLTKEKIAAKVVNGSISGDTTSGGRSRLPALLKAHAPTHVVIELGGNDALRGLPNAMTRDNLATMTKAAQDAGAQVLLLGMQLPPNFGADFGKAFADSFAQVAKLHNAKLVPFFLKGVADTKDPLQYFQADRIHPNEAAQPLMLANVWPALRGMLLAKK